MIKVLHLYHDLLNLYGENGNIKALTMLLNKFQIKYELDRKSINDELNILDYDFIYIGSGTEKNQDLALNHFLEYKDAMTEYINKSKMILVTGNALEMFGTSIETKNGNIKALGIFNYKSKRLDKRIVKEVYAASNISLANVVGFVNQSSISDMTNDPLFTCEEGTDGYKYKNFYATKLLGPLLVRNPYILTHLINKLLNTKVTNPSLGFQIDAYDAYVSKHNKNKKA